MKSATRSHFFDAMYQAALRAELQAGKTDHFFSIGGRSVRLQIIGEGFTKKLPPALSHLKQAAVDSTALTIYAWDDISTRTQLPKLLSRYLYFIELHCFDYRGPRNEMLDFHRETIRALMHLDPVIISLFDPQRSIALYWTCDVNKIPLWDWGSPLRIILNEWARLQQQFFVHSGAVGITKGAALFAGKSGSGKSTAALACLEHGNMKYLGDDYSLVGVEPEPYVHSLYSTAKLKGLADLEQFRQLLPMVGNKEKLDQQKALIFLAGAYRKKLSTGLPLRAILVPRITGKVESGTEPCSAITALKALAPSTLLQLPGTGKETMAFISELVRRVPAYTLHAGTSMSGISNAVESLLNEICDTH